MKYFLVAPLLFAIASVLTACDPQSGITKKSLEKFGPTPTPSVVVTPAETPVDPADVVQVDTSVQGPTISINTPNDKTNVNCDKYNRLMINSSDKVVTAKGACSQLMINGNRNKVKMDAVMEVVFNGEDNQVEYAHFGNGKKPVVTDNKGGNTVAKVEAAAPKK